MTQTVLNFKLKYGDRVEITPYAGLELYAEMYKTMGLNRLVEQRFPGPGSGAGFKANSYVEPIVMMFIGGGRYIEDIRKIQADEGLKRISQMKRIPTG